MSGVTRVVAIGTGTSVDALDVVAAEVRSDGGELAFTPLGHREEALPGDLRTAILTALPPAATTTEALCRIDADLGRAVADAARTGIQHLCGGRADVVVLLGQTLHHDVVDGVVRGTFQLGAPAYVAEATGLPVISDLRTRDVAAGGQGAPLVSRFDELLLAPYAADGPVAALNLGGIANLTVTGPGVAPLAFDCGPANALLDAAVQRATGDARDEGGALADRGRVDATLRRELLADPYLAQAPPKSTGKERYHVGYLDEVLHRAPVDDLADLLATLADAAATAVADAAAQLGVRRVWASGGGVRNAGLWRRLDGHLGERGATLTTTDDLGLPPDAKEAYAIALVGWCTWAGVPGNVPSCTGARGARSLGSVTPGDGPLRLPPPLPDDQAPTRLRVVPAATTTQGTPGGRS